MPPLRVLAILPHVIPSTTIGVIKPMQELHRDGQIIVRFSLEAMVSLREIDRADVVVFCRNTEPAYGGALAYAERLGKPMIYELDDDLFDIPGNTKVARYHHELARLDQLTKYLQSAALVRVYSETLRQRIASLNPNVIRIEGPIDWTLVSARPNRHKPANEIWIVYATSRIADELAEIFLDDVEQLLGLYPDRLKLFLWGYRPLRLAGYPNVRFLPYVPNYDRFFRQFASFGFDLGLAPLLNDVFHLSKSNNKFREYAASGIAGVYSNVAVYADCVQDGITGLLVENVKGAWSSALTRLIEEPDLRRAIQTQARLYARKHYDYSKFCVTWMDHFFLARTSTSAVPPAAVHFAPPSNADLSADALSLLKLARQSILLISRFFRQVRIRGLQNASDTARWTLNDLSILVWNRMNDW